MLADLLKANGHELALNLLDLGLKPLAALQYDRARQDELKAALANGRSLSDFAKMVDLFDERGVTFVSVTQQFNTTTSMGRLTLNILLSFAQFEREVTSERIRDKIEASKRKGLWVGGVVPLSIANQHFLQQFKSTGIS